jgi:Mn-dependent DtxR family transcriptional regulator
MDTVTHALTLILTHVEELGRPPTRRQLAALLGCSPSVAQDIIKGLTDRGYLELAGPSRAVTLTEKALILLHRI